LAMGSALGFLLSDAGRGGKLRTYVVRTPVTL
jgi:hypothetical protein